MGSPLEGQTLLFMWIGFLLLMTCGITAFFLWAVRAGQFADQDRARYLALQSGIPGNDEPEEPATGETEQSLSTQRNCRDASGETSQSVGRRAS